jgi:hypothetical protein
MNVTEAINWRHSIRAFLSEPAAGNGMNSFVSDRKPLGETVRFFE